MKKIMYFLISGLILIFTVCIILDNFIEGFDFFGVLSGLSTFVLVLINVCYVIMSSNQTEEIKKSREIQECPIPHVIECTFNFNKPEIKRSPTCSSFRNSAIDYFYFFSFNIFVKLKNFSSSPALCLDIIAEIEFKSIKLESVWKKIDIFPNTNEEKIDFRLFDDDNLSFLDAITDDRNFGNFPKRTFPKLSIKLIYRSISGAFFYIDNAYYIIPTGEEISSILKQWSIETASHSSELKESCSGFNVLYKKNIEKWEKELDILKNKFDLYISGEKKIDLRLSPIREKFIVKQLTEKEYFKFLENAHYGKVLGVSSVKKMNDDLNNNNNNNNNNKDIEKLN
ncbi:MAG: hypothetical protein ACRCSK_05445 [Fusobacteriaceae bacterium]